MNWYYIWRVEIITRICCYTDSRMNKRFAGWLFIFITNIFSFVIFINKHFLSIIIWTETTYRTHQCFRMDRPIQTSGTFVSPCNLHEAERHSVLYGKLYIFDHNTTSPIFPFKKKIYRKKKIKIDQVFLSICQQIFFHRYLFNLWHYFVIVIKMLIDNFYW